VKDRGGDDPKTGRDRGGARRAGDHDGEGSEFRRALDDVRPADRGKLRPEPRARVPVRPAAAGDAPVAFEIERAGERISGWAPGTDRRTRLRLRRGEIEVEREIDLHGLDARAAEQALRRTLGLALEAGERCVLVIHGRGLRSAGVPTLKEGLAGWLAKPPHGARVLAFESAGPGRGGTGATCVLLRRKR
jgi:DNA-nicking Smr family endonuclease